MKILGVTATPERLDGKGLKDAFDVLVHGPSVRELIGNGHLAEYEYFAPPEQVDLSKIRTTMGDFAIGELAAAMDRATITGDAVAHYRDHCGGRPAILFAVTVAHAEHVAAQFLEAGWRARSVDGKMDRGERRRRLQGLATGELNVLTSCELISEGVDVPIVSAAILLRPTKSLAMYLQQVGRCLRRKPDGSRAIILDHVGNVHRHGLPDTERLWSLEGRRKRPAAPPIRTCKLCYAVKDARVPIDCADPDCPLVASAAESTGAKGPPQVVDGMLTKVGEQPAWAGNIPVATATGGHWFRLLRLADTPEKLQEIARVRGYKPGWVRHILRERAARVA